MGKKLTALILVTMASDFVFGAVFVSMLQTKVGTPEAVGLVMALSTLVMTMFEAPSGAWADSYGTRRILVLGLLAWGVGMGSFAIAGGALATTGSMALWAVGMALFSGAPFTIAVNEAHRLGHSEPAIGSMLRFANVARWIGSAAGAAAVMFVGTGIPPEHLVLGAASALVVAGLWVALAWPTTRSDSPDRWLRGLTQSTRDTLRSPTLRQVMLVQVAFSVPLAGLLLLWQPIARAHGVPMSGYGLLFLGMTLAAAFGAVIVARMPERWRGMRLAILLSLFAGGSLAVSAQGPVVLAVAGLLGADLAVGAAGSEIVVLSHRAFPDSQRNTLSSLQGTVAGLAALGIEFTAGLVWDRLGLAVGGALPLLVVVVLLPVLERRRSPSSMKVQ